MHRRRLKASHKHLQTEYPPDELPHMSQSQWTLPVPDFDVQDFSNEIVSTPVVVDNAISNFKASSAGSNIQGAPQMFLEPTVCRVRPRGSISTNSSDTLDESHPQSGNSSEEPPLVRKGHSKSRRGCYNCKRRRVKVRFVADIITAGSK